MWSLNHAGFKYVATLFFVNQELELADDQNIECTSSDYDFEAQLQAGCGKSRPSRGISGEQFTPVPCCRKFSKSDYQSRSQVYISHPDPGRKFLSEFYSQSRSPMNSSHFLLDF